MERSATEEDECGICLDSLTNPVALPCSHKFCSGCLNGWRSKYGVQSGDKETNTKCPLCREKIPPSKEMISQLKFWRSRKIQYEATGDFSSENYTWVVSQMEKLECQVGDWTKSIYYFDEDKYLVLPIDIWKAVATNEIQKVLNWLGPLPVDKQRINAKDPDHLDSTLVHCAVSCKNSDLLSILLQLGADVDPVDADGDTPLALLGFNAEYYSQARLLLEWGADISNNARKSKDDFIKFALEKGNSKIANLVKSEFGGRRCEIINMPNQPDLIGKTCVVEKYLPNKSRYKVIFEATKEAGLVGPHNLKRRDRTPDDCGYYITYKNGKTNHHELASREECQAFVSSLTGAAAEARAEQAATSLLAELDIDASADSERKSKRGKKKGKKKGKK